MLNFIISNFICINFWHLISYFVTKNIRWFFIHIIANLIIVIITFKDVIHTLTHKNNIDYTSNIDGEIKLLNIIVTSLHLYHLLHTKKKEDYIHHITGIGIFNISTIYIKGSYPGSIVFFMNGLPGLIDYTLLIMVKTKIIYSETEKYINTYLNIYLRSLGTIFILGICYHENTHLNIWLFISLIGIIFNVQYYSREICINYGKNIIYK